MSIRMMIVLAILASAHAGVCVIDNSRSSNARNVFSNDEVLSVIMRHYAFAAHAKSSDVMKIELHDLIAFGSYGFGDKNS